MGVLKLIAVGFHLRLCGEDVMMTKSVLWDEGGLGADDLDTEARRRKVNECTVLVFTVQTAAPRNCPVLVISPRYRYRP